MRAKPNHILITGSAGAIGSTLVNGLKDRYTLRGLDMTPTPGLNDTIVGDITDFDIALRATRDVDAVIHLAAMPQVTTWEENLSHNIIGTYNLLEAARQNAVRRIAFASRAGLLSAYPEEITRTVDMLPRPNGLYSLSKAFGENLGYVYSTNHGLEFVAVRVGNFRLDRDAPEHPHHLSHGDAVRVFEQAVTHPGVTFAIVFGVSDSTVSLYDLEAGKKAIGYFPQDKSRP